MDEYTTAVMEERQQQLHAQTKLGKGNSLNLFTYTNLHHLRGSHLLEDLQSQLEEAEDLWWRIGKLRMDVIALELIELSQEWESFQQMNKQVRIPSTSSTRFPTP